VYLPTEQLGFNIKEKRIVFDLYCEDQSLNRIIIEMQRKELDYYVNRTLYYMGRSLSKSVKRGDLKYRMKKTISLHLLDYKSVWFENSNKLTRTIQLKDDKNKIFSEKVAIVLVNLCNFASRKKPIKFPSLRHKWVNLLKNMQKMTPEDEAKENDPIFKKLYEMSRLSNLNAEEMEEYKKSVLEYEDVQNAIECASKRSEARGEARGEAKAKRTMAFEMLKKGIPLSLISEISGLSETEILSLN
jgi:predicted transposase/invertase (TIGR01784 family)